MTENDSPLDLAKRLGRSIANSLGSEAFVELELAYASALLPRFSDNPLIRPRQNVLLYWPQSYFKSTLINQFAKCIPEALGIIDVTAMSPQMIFGGITEDRKNIIKPVFVGKRFALITELLSFIGTGNTMRDIVNTMNKVMEGDVVTRQLLKLGQFDFEADQIDKLMKEGIYYRPLDSELSYRPDVCVLAASRPIDNRTYTYLRDAGHLNRYHIIQHEISDEEARRYFGQDLHPDLKLQEVLKNLNLQLLKVFIKELKVPSKSILDCIMVPLEEISRVEARNQKLADVIDIRTKGDIIREITAHAFLRNVTANDFRDIEKLECTTEDVEFILPKLGHFIEFKINPWFVDEFTERKHGKKRPRDQVKELVLRFLSDKELRQKKEIDDYVNNKISVGPATISNALEDMISGHLICQPKYGFYKLKENCNLCKHQGACTKRDNSKMPSEGDGNDG